MSLADPRARQHELIEQSAGLLEQVSNASVSNNDQYMLQRLSERVRQLHAITPLINCLHTLGALLIDRGKIKPDGNPPARQAITILLKKYDAIPIETIMHYTTLKMQIHHAQQRLRGFLVEQDNLGQGRFYAQSSRATSKHLEKMVDMIALRDNLCGLAEFFEIEQQDNPFATAWETVSAIMKKFDLPGPVNLYGEPIMPTIPLYVEGASTQYSVSRWVLLDNMGSISSHVRELQDRALKDEIPAPQMHLTGDEQLMLMPLYRNGKFIHDVTVPVMKKWLMFTGEIPRLGSAIVLASITHEKKTDNSIRNRVAFSSEESERRIAVNGKTPYSMPPYCDHCGKSSAWHHTFLVESRSGIQQIGKTCMDEVVGENAESLMMKSFSLQEDLMRGEFWANVENRHLEENRQTQWYPIRGFLLLAIHFTQRYGFVKSDYSDSTRDRILDAIHFPEKAGDDVKSVLSQAFDGMSDDGYVHGEVDALIRHFLESNSNSDFHKNAQQLLSRPYVKLSERLSTGLLAALPNSLQNAQKRQEKRNEAFGTEKMRGPLKLRVNDVEDNSLREHPSVKYKMQDDEGRKFTWSASWPGNEVLKVGRTVTLIATIKSHFRWDGGVTTLLSRCADIVEVSPDHPAPDFEAGVKKRAFKETINLSWEPFAPGGKITGESHLHIHRIWKEDGRVHELKHGLSVPFSDDDIKDLIARMAHDAHVSRTDGDGNVDMKNAKDRKFLKEIRAWRKSTLTNIKTPLKDLYMVDDAFAHKFCTDTDSWGAPHGTPDDVTRRRPLLFTSISLAEQQGKLLIAGRLSTIKLKSPAPLICPMSLRLQDAGSQTAFRQKAIQKGFNILMLTDTSGNVKRLEPLGWSPSMLLNKTALIKSMRPIHRPMSQAIENQSSRYLRGLKFVAISGLTTHPDRAEKLRHEIRKMDFMESFDEHKILPDLLSPTDPSCGGDSMATSLRYICEDKNRRLSTTTRLMVLVDDTTTYYLKQFGADVVDIRLRNKGSEDSVLPSDAYPVTLKGNQPGVWITQIVNRITQALNDPERNTKRLSRR